MKKIAHGESQFAESGLGRTTFGLWLAIPSSFGAELAAGADLDYVVVDQQHGIVVGYDSMVPVLQATRPWGLRPSHACSPAIRSGS